MTRTSSADRRIPVAVLGATGFVGQVMLRLLRDHPWFRVGALMASDRSVGRAYGEACAWAQTEALDPRVAAMVVRPVEPGGDWPIVLSALPTDAAREHERAFARAGHLVVSNASAHRLDDDVPLLVPEVNAAHLELARARQPGPGWLLTNPNCTTVGLVLALAPLAAAFGVRAVSVVSLQALSGAGLPGPSAVLALDNVLPYIAGEEEKLLHETNRLLGTFDGARVVPSGVEVSAQCTRVPVSDGHTLCVSVGLRAEATRADVLAAWDAFRAPDDVASLPSVPGRPVRLLPGDDAPQPRLHRNLDGGMAVAVGRLRACPLLGHRFVALVHNTVRGAAGAALGVAELAVARGLAAGVEPPR